MENKIYTGIGARNVPFDIMGLMTDIAKILDTQGFTLRSGGANGSDSAFEKGAINKEIYLPWENFNNKTSIFTEPQDLAFVIAKKFHPKWSVLSPKARLLMARNTHQILGFDFKIRSDFVICWTPDGCEDGLRTTKDTGGTGQAIRIAFAYDVPVFNLRNKTALNRLDDYLQERK